MKKAEAKHKQFFSPKKSNEPTPSAIHNQQQ